MKLRLSLISSDFLKIFPSRLFHSISTRDQAVKAHGFGHGANGLFHRFAGSFHDCTFIQPCGGVQRRACLELVGLALFRFPPHPESILIAFEEMDFKGWVIENIPIQKSSTLSKRMNVGVNVESQAYLAHVGTAFDLSGLFLCFGKSRQKHPCQNGDNGNDHQ
jgi:hypothetical protein